MNKLKIVLAFTMVVAMMWLTSGSGCSTGSGGGGVIQAPCASELTGAWSFMGRTSNGTLNFGPDGNVTGITQSGACSGFALTGTSSSDLGTYPMVINYTVKCSNGKTYPYTLRLNPVDDDCKKLSGTKKGTYSGGITENIALIKK